MILPLAHEHQSSRRLPVVTIVIMVVCFVALVVTERATPLRMQRAEAAIQAAIAYRNQHPYLDRCPKLQAIPLPERTPGEGRPRIEPPADEVRRAEQQRLDALCASIDAEIARLPAIRFGYVPARNNLLGLFTYQFLHGGYLHLLGNLWFLWLCGCNMEDRWGRAVYGPFYLAAGVVAALAHKLFGTHPEVPLVGASGAIAGAMGAFLVAFARARIHFVTLVRFRPRFFTAPAYLMLPLWLGSQLLYALSGLEDGVAYTAHVGGFVFGAAVALVLRLSGVEKKLDDAVEQTVTVTQDPRLQKAGELITEERAAEALPILDALQVEMPLSIDVQLELLRAAKALGDRAREIAAYARLIQLYFNGGEEDAALSLFREVAMQRRAQELPAAVLLRAAGTLERRDWLREAEEAYAAVYAPGIHNLMAVKAVIGHAKIAAYLGRRDEARELFTAARESPFSTLELDNAVDAELAKL
jgi:membrane associated rhomboid family serine protease